MKTENKFLMKQAREALAGKWKLAVGVSFIYMLILFVFGYPPHNIGTGLSFLISAPLMIGWAAFSLSLSRGKEAKLSQLFVSFHEFNEYIRALTAYLVIFIFAFLWFLLLIVPGIIAFISYSQTYYILAEDKSISARDAVKKSKAMMRGNKKKLFFLMLRFFGWGLLFMAMLVIGFILLPLPRFFGWGLLCVFISGIAYVWLMPYVQVTLAKFYDDISGKSVPVSGASQETVANPAL